ncbi:MAG: hypothetical protein PVI99_07270 [Anaerolineales bacterium]|jgi:hypothetical protein
MSNFSTEKSLGKILGGLALLVLGLSFSFLVIKNTITDFPIWFFGDSVLGVVDEKWYEITSEEDAEELTFKYFARYNFISPDGEKITGSTSLSAQEWSALINGGAVRVVYSPLNPENNRIDDSRFRPLLLCSYIPFLILSIFFVVQGWNLLSGEFKKRESVPWRVEQKED